MHYSGDVQVAVPTVSKFTFPDFPAHARSSLNNAKSPTSPMVKALTNPAATFLRPQWLVVAALVALLSFVTPQLLGELQLLPTQPSAAKPYADLRSFRPRYIDDHQNKMSVTLHITGTSFALLFVLANPELFGSGLLALKSGQVAFELLRHQDTGIGEGLVVVFVFLATTRFLGGSTRTALAVLFCGYFCAWTGHFFFEGNRPATFIYPTYSLICDLMLWAETITGITITL